MIDRLTTNTHIRYRANNYITLSLISLTTINYIAKILIVLLYTRFAAHFIHTAGDF